MLWAPGESVAGLARRRAASGRQRQTAGGQARPGLPACTAQYSVTGDKEVELHTENSSTIDCGHRLSCRGPIPGWRRPSRAPPSGLGLTRRNTGERSRKKTTSSPGCRAPGREHGDGQLGQCATSRPSLGWDSQPAVSACATGLADWRQVGTVPRKVGRSPAWAQFEAGGPKARHRPAR